MSRWSKVLTTQDDERALEAGWHRVRARRSRPRFARGARVVAPLVALVAVIALVARSWVSPPPTAALAAGSVAPGLALAPIAPGLALAPIALEGGAALPAEWSAAAPVTVPFDDGSRLELGPRAVVRSATGAPDRVELAVQSGRTTFDVKPNGPRSWVIEAGPVVVRVLGTRFTIARSGDTVEVSVERGKVSVSGAAGVRVLTPGESFTTDPPKSPVPPAASARLAPPALRAPAPARPVDPMSRADALRRSGDPSAAVAVLAEVDDGERRALAAFTIGKIRAEDLHDPAGAARWFEQAIALGLPSGLDEEAHARAVESLAHAGARAGAKQAAQRYEARFPDGRHLAQVKEWSRD